MSLSVPPVYAKHALGKHWEQEMRPAVAMNTCSLIKFPRFNAACSEVSSVNTSYSISKGTKTKLVAKRCERKLLEHIRRYY